MVYVFPTNRLKHNAQLCKRFQAKAKLEKLFIGSETLHYVLPKQFVTAGNGINGKRSNIYNISNTKTGNVKLLKQIVYRSLIYFKKMRLFMDDDRELGGGWNDPPSTRGRSIVAPSGITIAMTIAFVSIVLFSWFYLCSYV